MFFLKMIDSKWWFIPVMLICLATSASGQTMKKPEIISEIRVIGNAGTSTEAIITMSGLCVGQKYDSTLVFAAISNLRTTGNFRSIYSRAENIGGNRMRVYLLVEEKRNAYWIAMPMYTPQDGPGAGYRSLDHNYRGMGRTMDIKAKIISGGPKSPVSFYLQSVLRNAPNPLSNKRWERYFMTQGRVWNYFSGLSSVGSYYHTELKIYTQADWKLKRGRFIRTVLLGRMQYNSILAGNAPLLSDSAMAGTGLDYVIDTRDDYYAPRHGRYGLAGFLVFDCNSQLMSRIHFEVRDFHTVDEKTVLAFRVKTAAVSRSAPYGELFFSTLNEFRGYRPHSQSGHEMFSMSFEFRRNMKHPDRYTRKMESRLGMDMGRFSYMGAPGPWLVNLVAGLTTTFHQGLIWRVDLGVSAEYHALYISTGNAF